MDQLHEETCSEIIVLLFIYSYLTTKKIDLLERAGVFFFRFFSFTFFVETRQTMLFVVLTSATIWWTLKTVQSKVLQLTRRGNSFDNIPTTYLPFSDLHLALQLILNDPLHELTAQSIYVYSWHQHASPHASQMAICDAKNNYMISASKGQRFWKYTLFVWCFSDLI